VDGTWVNYVFRSIERALKISGLRSLPPTRSNTKRKRGKPGKHPRYRCRDCDGQPRIRHALLSHTGREGRLSTRSYRRELGPTVEKTVQEVSKHIVKPMAALMRNSLTLRHAPGRARTCNPMIRSHILPIELFPLGFLARSRFPITERERHRRLHEVLFDFRPTCRFSLKSNRRIGLLDVHYGDRY
jgi:hypothetical protein